MNAADPRVMGAAHRCGADADVWVTAHELHLARTPALVDTSAGDLRGPIIGLSDTGLTVRTGPGESTVVALWRMVRHVAALEGER